MVVVLVMHYLFGRQQSPKDSFCNQPVLSDSLHSLPASNRMIWGVHQRVAILVHAATTIPLRVPEPAQVSPDWTSLHAVTMKNAPDALGITLVNVSRDLLTRPA